MPRQRSATQMGLLRMLGRLASGSRKVWLILISVLALFFFLILHSLDSASSSAAHEIPFDQHQNIDQQPPVSAQTHKYALLIDAGSSGSRVYLYKQDQPRSQQEYLMTYPRLTRVVHSQKVTPGMSSFAAVPEKELRERLSTYWSDLLYPALDHIPAERVQNTIPIYILATAGMRLVQPGKAKQIISETCRFLLAKYMRSLDSGVDESACIRDHVRIISGEEEALFGWISINFLMGRLGHVDDDDTSGEPTRKGTVGFLDMGGASAQIAFEPSPQMQMAHMEDLWNVTLMGVKRHLYVTSFLGFGSNQARKAYLESLNSTSDPCLPKDFIDEQTKLTGMGDLDECQKQLIPLLHKEVQCPDQPCLFNGVHSPRIPFDQHAFVGVSEYWWATEDIFDLGGPYQYSQLRDKSADFCSKDWENTIAAFPDEKVDTPEERSHIAMQCFKTAWVMVMLHDGFGLDRPDEGHAETRLGETFWSANDVKGQDASWTTGAYIFLLSDKLIDFDSIDKTTSDTGDVHQIDQPPLSESSRPLPFIVVVLLFIAGVMGVAFLSRCLLNLTRVGAPGDGGAGVRAWMSSRSKYHPLSGRGQLVSRDPISMV